MAYASFGRHFYIFWPGNKGEGRDPCAGCRPASGGPSPSTALCDDGLSFNPVPSPERPDAPFSLLCGGQAFGRTEGLAPTRAVGPPSGRPPQPVKPAHVRRGSRLWEDDETRTPYAVPLLSDLSRDGQTSQGRTHQPTAPPPPPRPLPRSPSLRRVVCSTVRRFSHGRRRTGAARRPCCEWPGGCFGGGGEGTVDWSVPAMLWAEKGIQPSINGSPSCHRSVPRGRNPSPTPVPSLPRSCGFGEGRAGGRPSPGTRGFVGRQPVRLPCLTGGREH